MLDGDGTLELTPPGLGAEPEAQPVRKGSVVARPPGTGVAHAFRAGESGMTLIAWGDARPERHLLVPALAEDLLAGRGRGRPDRAARLLGRRRARVIAHWDEVDAGRDLGQAAGALNVGLRRLELTPGETIAQGDARTEEILFVLAGSGSSQDGEARRRFGPATASCARSSTPAMSLRAGDDGLTVFVSSGRWRDARSLGRRAAADPRPRISRRRRRLRG